MQHRGDQLDKRRALTKVRRNFINKTPEQLEDENPVSPSRWPSTKTVHVLNNVLGVVEINRKIYMGWQFLTPHYLLDKPIVDCRRSVTINIKANENHPITKTDYCIKRLESYGDLELATWAHKIKKHNTNLSNAVAQYVTSINWEDSQVVEEIRTGNAKAARAMQEVENKYPYRKLSSIADQHSIRMTSCAYSEQVINGMGFSVEDFVVELKKNGFPTLFQKDCKEHLDFAKRYIDFFVFSGERFQEGDEYTVYVYDRDGKKREVIAQTISIIEILEEGLKNTGYIIIKSVKLYENHRLIENDETVTPSDNKLKEFKRNLDEVVNEIRRMAIE